MGGERSREELERALRDAEEAIRVRDEFLRLAGHELRSPLTAAQLQVDMLTMLVREGGGASAIEERTDRVRRSLGRLSWLIEEVLDLGRASGGGLRLHVGEVELVAVARRVLDRFTEEIRRARCDVRLVESGAVVGLWDASRVEHAVGSLILAALKSGADVIDVEVSGQGAAAVVRVRGGPDLAAGASPLVFESFDRVLAGLEPGSQVLALWLVRVVAESHGGCLQLGPGVAELSLPRSGGRPPA